MPRRRRIAPAGYVYHVLNRAAGRASLFREAAGEPAGWLATVQRAETPGELAALRRGAWKGTPLGGERWTRRVAAELDLGPTLRERGRPRKQEPTDDNDS